MIKKIITIIIICFYSVAWAYTPTIESLFRNGANPDITSNAIVVRGEIYGEGEESDKIWFKWIIHRSGDKKIKLTQLIYHSANYDESSLVDKVFVGDLNIFKNQSSKGLVASFISSTVLNDGSYIIDYLNNKKILTRNNLALISKEKRILLQKYKTWLIKSKGGRVNIPEASPLEGQSSDERIAIKKMLSSSMYIDEKDIRLINSDMGPVWYVEKNKFVAKVLDESRQIVEMGFIDEKNILQASDFQKYASGHTLPRQLIYLLGDNKWVIKLNHLGHQNDSLNEHFERLRKWDQFLQNKTKFEKPQMLF